MTKLHLGAGSVYLRGYTNIDVKQPNYFLATQRPDLVEKNGTTINNYYRREVSVQDYIAGTYHETECVVDVFCDIRYLNYDEESVDEIVLIHVLEHFNLIDATTILYNLFNILKVGGTLRVHVPDIEGIMRAYVEGEDIEWVTRQLYGSQKNKYSVHPYGYTQKSLINLLKKVGFSRTTRTRNINDYPAFGIVATK